MKQAASPHLQIPRGYSPTRVARRPCLQPPGHESSCCRAGLHRCVSSISPGGRPLGVLSPHLAVAPQRCSTSPRRQGCSVWKSNRRRWATGSSEVGLVVFCLPVLSSESGFHPRPRPEAGAVPSTFAMGSGTSARADPTSWPGLAHSSQGTYPPCALLTPSLPYL